MKKIQDENGSALIIVLVVLVSVTILGIAAMNSSDFETIILGSYKNHEITFHLTEGSVAASSKMIHHVINKKDTYGVPTDFIVGSDDTDNPNSTANKDAFESFKKKITDYPEDGAVDLDDPDIIYNYGNQTGDILMTEIDVDVEIDFKRIHHGSVAGSSAEFMQNAGDGKQNRTEILYGMTATGTGKKKSKSVITAVYGDVQ